MYILKSILSFIILLPLSIYAFYLGISFMYNSIINITTTNNTTTITNNIFNIISLLLSFIICSTAINTILNLF